MKLTERQAIEKSIELWEWLAKTGSEHKIDWDGWEENEEITDDCFLCEYAVQKSGTDYLDERCLVCPYYRKYGYKCFEDSSSYCAWDEADDKKGRKKYAKQFLNQLKALLDDKETVTVEVELDAEVLLAMKSLHKITDAILEGLDPEDKQKLEA